MTSNLEQWYQLRNADSVDSPALLIYPARVKENIRLLTTLIDNLQRLRPHVKTHKNREATQLMLEAGIQKFKCATIAEAEMLAQCNTPDVLLAYQPTGPKLQRFITLIQKYPHTAFSCLIDHLDTAREQSRAFTVADITVPVYIDLNIGQNRTGIAPDHALALYEACVSLPGIRVAGLHAYDGHIKEKSLAARTVLAEEGYRPVTALLATLREKGFPEPVVIAGGSPTFPIHALREKVECSPGTFILWDKGYSEYCPEQPFQPAALVLTRVISLPDATRICLDLGHKSIAAENELDKRVHFLNAPDLKPVGQSEEHLVLEAGPGHSYAIGDILYGLPVHICPTVALYERAITVENGEANGEWRIIARDRKLTY